MKQRIARVAACLVAALCLVGCPKQRVHAQVPVSAAPVPHPQFFAANGQPLAGGQLFTYQAGTTTPLATYTDSTGTVANPNPVILNAGGFTPNGLWLIGQPYKFVLENSSGVIQWTADNILPTTVTPGNGVSTRASTATSDTISATDCGSGTAMGRVEYDGTAGTVAVSVPTATVLGNNHCAFWVVNNHTNTDEVTLTATGGWHFIGENGVLVTSVGIFPQGGRVALIADVANSLWRANQMGIVPEIGSLANPLLNQGYFTVSASVTDAAHMHLTPVKDNNGTQDTGWHWEATCLASCGTPTFTVLSTNSSTTETVPVSGVTSSSVCVLFPANALAATNSTSTYISSIAAGLVTFTTNGTSGMSFYGVCRTP